MTLAAYHGHEALTFNDYIDLGTGRTLHAEPGGTYDITPAGGRQVDEVPAPWFTPAEAAGAEAEAEAAWEPAGETPETGEQDDHAAGEVPETGEPEQF